VSDDRIYDLSITRTVAKEQGKIKDVFKSVRFRAYSAGQFKKRLDGANFSIKIPLRKSDRKEFYLTMFRVKIGDKWYEPSGRRYEFFTVDEFYEIIKNWGES